MAHCAHWSWLSPIFKASSHLFEIETHFSVDVVLVVAIEENITYDFLLFTVIILMRSFLSIQKLVGRIWLDEIVLHTCIFEHHWLIRNSNQDSRKVIILIIIFNICPRLADVFNYMLLKMPNFLSDSCHHVIMRAWDLDFWSKLERIFETFQIR